MKITKKHLFMGFVFFFSLFFIFQVFAQYKYNWQTDKYLIETIVLPNGKIIEGRILPSPPTPPTGFERVAVGLPEPNPAEGVNVLSSVPAFNWSFGCTATSAAMIAGYYDRTGYANMYTGPTNGGVVPMDNSSWPDWVDSHGDTRHQCPLSATHNGLDGRTTKGHVDDYWIYYGQPGPDPWDGNWAEHAYGDCTGDYMKTNQWFASEGFNTDGSTVYYSYTDGSPLYESDIESYGLDIYDGPYGFKQFYESRGYSVSSMYTQKIKGQGSNPSLGFTYAQFCSEIDAGRPVMIHLAGHTIVGVGYDNSSSNLIYLHDTWDYSTYTMIWGSTYSGMQHLAVSIVQLASEDNFYYVFDGHDFDGNGTSDISLYRPTNGMWYIKDGISQQWGAPGDIPAQGNYDLDTTTEIAIWRPSNGLWYISGISTSQWGVSGDIPVPHDYNGGGVTDIAVWRPSNGIWYIKGVGDYQWGQAGDYPVPGDYNGDGVDEVGVWRPAEGAWYISGVGYYQWGSPGDIPVPADGKTDLAVFRPAIGMWYIQYMGGGASYVQWGMMGDVPVPGDYDGNGTTEVAIWRTSNGLWYINGNGTYQWGYAGDIPLVR
jgi:hypothetical protein